MIIEIYRLVVCFLVGFLSPVFAALILIWFINKLNEKIINLVFLILIFLPVVYLTLSGYCCNIQDFLIYFVGVFFNMMLINYIGDNICGD